MKPRRSPILSLAPLTLEERIAPALFTWTGKAGLADSNNRAMSIAGNWDKNLVPSAVDDVRFPTLAGGAYGKVIADLAGAVNSITVAANGYEFFSDISPRPNLNGLQIEPGVELRVRGLFFDAKLNIADSARLVQIDPGVFTSDFNGTITLQGTGEFAVSSISGNGSVTLDKGSKLNPGKRAAADNQLFVPGSVSINNSATLEIDIVPDTSAPLSKAVSDQISVLSKVNLDAGAKLSIFVAPDAPLALGDQFVIVNNLGSNAINGQFANLPEGSIVRPSNDVPAAFRISYAGGSGNDDIVLTVVNALTSITSTSANGSYNTGQTVNVRLEFSDIATLTGGTMLVFLDTGATLNVSPGKGKTLDATYTVQAGQLSPDLNVVAISLRPSTFLRDALGNDIPLQLPPANLAVNKNIAINFPNTPPTISDIPNGSILPNTLFGPVAFTIGDLQSLPANLKLSATSSNPLLVPVGNITFGGSDAKRTLSVLPASNQTGISIITVTVTDTGGLSASDSFTLTVSSTSPPPPTSPPPTSPPPTSPPPTSPPPGTPPPSPREFSVGSDVGAGVVTLRNPDSSFRFALAPFGKNFFGGVRTATGDVNGDGVADLICASGPGIPGTVRIFDGVSQKPIELPETVAGGGRPFGDAFIRGINVATGDLNGDGLSDLIITAEAGGGARVRVFQSTGSGFVQRSDFIALIGSDNVPDSKVFRGGSRAAVSDINGDGIGDLVWAAGAGGGPRIAIFDGARLDGGTNVFFKITGDFFALSPSLRDGCFIAGGDVDGDGIGDLMAGGGSGAPPQVVGYSGKNLRANTFTRFVDFQFGTNSKQGIRVAVKKLNDDAFADVIVGSAPAAGSRVAAFSGKNLSGSNTGAALFDTEIFPSFTNGVFVG